MKNQFGLAGRKTLSFLSPALIATITFCGCSSLFTDAFDVGSGVMTGALVPLLAADAVQAVVMKGIEGTDKQNCTFSAQPEAQQLLLDTKSIMLSVEKAEAQPGGSNQTRVFQDALTGHLMQMGYDVVNEMPENEAGPLSREGGNKRTIQAKVKSPTVVINCSIAEGKVYKYSNSFGFSAGDTREINTVQSASIRISSFEEGKIILAATVAYKKGKNLQEAAKDMAGLIAMARNGSAGDKDAAQSSNQHARRSQGR